MHNLAHTRPTLGLAVHNYLEALHNQARALKLNVTNHPVKKRVAFRKLVVMCRALRPVWVMQEIMP